MPYRTPYTPPPIPWWKRTRTRLRELRDAARTSAVNWFEHHGPTAVVAVTGAIFVGLLTLGVVAYNRKHRGHGHAQVNCRDETSFVPMRVGNITILTPLTNRVCDTICVVNTASARNGGGRKQ